MSREIDWKRALFNAGFAAVVLALAGFGIAEVARRQWVWQKTAQLQAAFGNVAGLEPGAKVLFQGLDAGMVDSIEPPAHPNGPVIVKFRLDGKLQSLVRADAIARITTQGVVGAKVLEILPGSPNGPALAPGQTLASQEPQEWSDLVQQAQKSLNELDSVAKAAKDGLQEINAIAGTIRRGEGSLGRLVQDDEAYQRIITLSKEGEKTLTDLQENLAAVKGIWPISTYFKERGFKDGEHLLFQPGADRQTRTIPESDLFEPGRAILTDQGRKQLDEVARWFKARKPSNATQVVVASFTDTRPQGNEELAQILTQEQAQAVRSYLINQHHLDYLAWYRIERRRIAAIGFGTEMPYTDSPQNSPSPSRRVEIILYTPQA